jgi:hypothetical protein
MSNNENLKQLMQDIIKTTLLIETKYPELYKFIEELPHFNKFGNEKSVSILDLENYLNTLKIQLKKHIEFHQKTE